MTRTLLGLLLAGSLTVACEARLSDGEAGEAGEAGEPGGGTNEPGIPDITTANPETLSDGVPAASRVLRLSYGDYDRTVSDLLGLEVHAAALFPAEPPSLGPYEELGTLSVNERLYSELRIAAEDLAADVLATPAAFATVVPCTTEDAACRDQFVDSFLLRAYRRPPSEGERARLTALFDGAGELVQSGNAFRDGVGLVVEAVLQSAKFLYRVEVGSGTQDESGTRLNDYEIATRLSYLFWGTSPDAELLDAAAAGKLSTADGLAQEAARLAADPRVRARVLDFHERWIQLDGLNGTEKDPARFPLYSPELLASMKAETRRFIETVTLEQGGAVRALLTSPIAFVDQNLAPLYGLSGSFGQELTRVDLPVDGPRKGLLTQAAFLTGHSSASTRTSPILRGVFVLDRLACQTIPPPPPGAEMMEPEEPPATELLTTRQYFEWKTSMATCSTCHEAINPAGFAFEGFDAIGAQRTTENGAPIDATGSVPLGKAELSFETAAEFVEGLAELSQTRACYAQHWLRYAYGRAEAGGDARTLGLLTRDLEQDDFGVREVLQGITRGAAFSHLPPRQD
jgi:hypothetical protein